MTNLGHVYSKNKYRDELNNLEKKRKMNSTLLVNIFGLFYYGRPDCYFNNMNFLGFIMPYLTCCLLFYILLMETELGFTNQFSIRPHHGCVF
jgi:hypothetical protein